MPQPFTLAMDLPTSRTLQEGPRARGKKPHAAPRAPQAKEEPALLEKQGSLPDATQLRGSSPEEGARPDKPGTW